MQHTPDGIRELLSRAESEHTLSIIYGLESGSRAWGFESQNSDYDVRFLYVRPVDWYLCIEKRGDTVDLGTSHDIDLNGWDLRKSLLFLRRSHPVLLEWLRSPVVYVERPEIVQRMREIGEEFFAPRASVHHYVSWAERTLQRYFRHSDLAAKRYLYVMRPILCCRWIQAIGGQPPLRTQTLIAAADMPAEAELTLSDLFDRRRAGYELDSVGRLPVLDRYISEAMPQIKDFLLTLPKTEQVPFGLLNPLFHQALEACSEKSFPKRCSGESL